MNPDIHRIFSTQERKDVLDQGITKLQERYFMDWLMAETVEERERLHAKAQVLADAMTELFM